MVEEAEEHRVIIHEHSYPDDSIVLELRPESHDSPWEEDMTRLTREDAQELKDQLQEVLDEFDRTVDRKVLVKGATVGLAADLRMELFDAEQVVSLDQVVEEAVKIAHEEVVER